MQKVEVSLFPGYLFVCTSMSAARRVELLELRGAVDLVGRLPGDARVAQAIPDEQIQSLETLVAAAVNLDPTERLVVQIELLGRGVSAWLSGEDVVEA